MTVGATGTAAKALSVVAMGTAYGSVSGLYAALARTPAWAVFIGFMMFWAQFLLDFTAVALGLSKVNYGM